MIALSFVGIVVALSFVCVTMYRGWSPLVAVPCGAVILALFSGMNPGDALVGPFMKQTCNLFNTIGPLFMTGSMLASTMEHTGSARSIARFLSKTFGVKNCCWVILIVAGLLSYGGMSLGGYLIVFPIAVYLVKQANYDRNIVLGLILGGSWSFASWGPFAPSTGNIYIQNAMGTPSSAGLIPGMVALVVDIVILGFYFQWQAKRWQKQGRFYEDDSTVAVDENEMERTAATDPNLIVSLIPPILVIVLYNVVKLNIAVSCTLAWLACVLLNLRRFEKGQIRTLATKGLGKAVIPAISMGMLGGIGAVVALTPAYETVLHFLENTTAHPYLVCILAANGLAAMLGSASGGVALMMSSMMPYFERIIAMGYNAGNIHRLVEMASLGLDSLPCNGTIASCSELFNMPYKKAYWPVFVSCTLINILVTLLVALPLMMMGLT